MLRNGLDERWPAIAEADLRFLSEETTAFLTQLSGLTLSAEEITALETRTEGWIAGCACTRAF